MAKHDFLPLFSKYPETILQMPDRFNSHEFILRLARNNQAEYVEALYAYRDSYHGDKPAPFKAVHSILAGHLSEHPTLVGQMGVDTSTDIFGQPNGSTTWKKV